MWQSAFIWTTVFSFSLVYAFPFDPPFGKNFDPSAIQRSEVVVVDSNNGRSLGSNDTTTSSSDDIVVVVASSTPEAVESSSETPTLNNSDDSGNTENMLFDYVSEMMVAQCDGKRTPAINFYQCLEGGSSQLNQFLNSIGLNVTKLRLEISNNSTNTTIDTLDDNNNVTTSASSDTDGAITATDSVETSTLNLLSSSDIRELNTILAGAYTQADKLCMNVDMLLSCLDPYLETCFPDATMVKPEDTPIATSESVPEALAITTPRSTNSSAFDRWLMDVFGMINMFDIHQNTTTDDDQSVSTTGLPTTISDPEVDTSGSVNDTMDSNSHNFTINNTSEVRPRFVVAIVELTMVIPEDSMQGSLSNLDDKTDMASEAEDVVYGFFDLPLLNQRSQISRLLSQTFRLLCESNSDNSAVNTGPVSLPVKDVLSNFACINRQVTTDNHDTCQTSSDRLAEVEQQIQTLSLHPKENSSLIPYQNICQAVDEYSRCYIRAASECMDGQSEGQSDRKNLPDMLHAIVDLYLDECQSSANLYQNTAPAPPLITGLQVQQ